MAFKFIVALAFVAFASAGLVPTAQVYHAAQPVLTKSEDSYDPHPQYQFSYEVNDAHTGDSKSQTETRDGDVVQGEYSLIDADGYKRTVQYTADPTNGFNAIVNRQPLGQVVKTVAAAPVAYHAPTLIKSYAAAPSASISYAAPTAYTQTYAAAAPALIRSASIGYAAPNAYTQTYAAAAPTLIRSSPIAYAHAPAAYTTQTLVKSSPLAYAAPAYAYHH